MRAWQSVEFHCSSCHGTGTVWEEAPMADGVSITAMTCHCVTYHFDAEMKEFLAKFARLTSA